MALSIDIELKNYRCFEDTAPARFTLKSGFTGLIGKNNSGKSTVLRLLFELRSLFQALGNAARFRDASRATNQSFDLPSGWTDAQPLFCDLNQRPLTIGLRVSDPSEQLIPQLIEICVDLPPKSATRIVRDPRV